jgi:hypothetical protein
MTELRSVAERGTANKTAPVTGLPVFDPEYADVPTVYHGWGIKRSLLYQLIKEGSIQSVSLRRRKGKIGKRLINVASLRAFLKTGEAKQ